MSKSKKFLSVVLSLVLLLTCTSMGITVSAATSGITGDCKWTLNGTKLTISGNGEMERDYWDYENEISLAPWGNAITELVVEDGVTYISVCGFIGCERLTTVKLADSVSVIGDNAFSSCTSLNSLTLSKGLKFIDAYAFADCYNLINITLPENLEYIEETAFCNCVSLKNIFIPDSVMFVAPGAFIECSGLTDITVGKNNLLYSSDNGVLYSKDKTEIVTVPGGKTGSFSIPNGVERVGDYAFFACRDLTNITIPDSVTSIGFSAFYDTYLYDDDNLAEGKAIYVGNYLIETNPDNMSGEYQIRQGTTCIADGAFMYDGGLTGVQLPESLKYIGIQAFSDCGMLSNIAMPHNVVKIGNEAFKNTAYYNNGSNWQNGVLYIGEYLIEADRSKTSEICTVRSGTVCIADGAFEGCGGLRTIELPAEVKYMSLEAFVNCFDLEKLNVNLQNADYSSVDGVLYNKDNTQLLLYPCGRKGDFKIPDGVKTIASGAFCSAPYITGVTIPESVTTIEFSAFVTCSGLESVFIPKTVKTIEDGAFVLCDNAVLNVSENSAAHKYAVKNGMKFKLIEDMCEHKYSGDCDATCNICGRSRVTSADHTFGTDNICTVCGFKKTIGDVNGDGVVNSNDAIEVLKHDAKIITLSGSLFDIANVDGDETVNSNDAVLILKYDAKLIDEFPVK